MGELDECLLWAVLGRQRRASSFWKPDDIVATHEGDGAFFLDCLNSGVSGFLVGGELVVPDMAGAILVEDFKHPVLIRFGAIDFDGEGIAVDDDALAFARRDDVRFFFDHLMDPGLWVPEQYARSDKRVNRPRKCGPAVVSHPAHFC